MDKLPVVIKQLGYTPGELKVTLTGVLTEVSQVERQIEAKRKALKIGESDQQSYTLLENALLEASLKRTQVGQSAALTGLLSVYKKKHYLWL